MTPSLKAALAGLATVALLGACVGPSTRYPTLNDQIIAANQADAQRNLITEHLERTQRIYSLAWPILEANAELCGSRLQRIDHGFTIGNDETLVSLFDGFNRAQIRALGYTSAPIVMTVAASGPAGGTGLEPGARLLKIGEQDVSASIIAVQRIMKVQAALADELGEKSPPLALTVLQDGEEKRVEIQPRRICNVVVNTTLNPVINASAGTKAINIHSGLIEFFDDDDAISVVIAHEVGHVAGRHVNKALRNALTTGYLAWGLPLSVTAGVIDLFTGPALEALAGVETPPGQALVTRINNATVGTRNFEREADYVGMYFATRAGVNTNSAELIFRKFSELSPRNTYGERTHPISAERMALITNVRAEISAKIRAGEPLVPNGWEDRLGEAAEE